MEGLTCPLGAIADLSASGMRVRTEGASRVSRGAAGTFTICAGTKCMAVEGLVVWSRRVAWHSKDYEFGVKFTDARPAVRKVLRELAEHGFFRDPDVEESRVAQVSFEVEDLYAVMGVAPNASAADLRSAYHKLAKELHPDHCKDPGAGERFTLVSKAWSVLRNESTRAKYDIMLKSAVKKTG